ncbi:MAG: hypothetical protein HC802_12190 [Caldilineaceae bacterium]|nr:hypothetical protein [Caldilineaceae bacterium]
MLEAQIAEGASVDEHQRGEYFSAVESAFWQAAHKREMIELDFQVAGQLLRLHFAGNGMAPIVAPSFDHLAIPRAGSDPAFSVLIWDSATTGISMPSPPWSVDAYSARGDILGYNSDRYRSAYAVHCGAFYIADMARNRAIYWVRDAALVPGYERGKPMRPILNWWLNRLDCQLVHGGAVGTENGAALLAGKGGAGKSNSALACLRAGMFYLSDDFCAVQADPPPKVYSLFGSAKLHVNDLERLPFLRSEVSNPHELPEYKAVFFLNKSFPNQVVAEMPLRVILLPRLSGRSQTTWEDASRGAAHRALAEVTLNYLPGAGRTTFQIIAQLVKRLPAYHLNLGSEIDGVASAVEQIIDEA